MKKLFLSLCSLLLIAASSFAAGNGSGTDCSNAKPVIIGSTTAVSFDPNQTQFYFEFTATTTGIELDIEAGSQSPFALVDTIQLYLNMGCGNLQQIYNKAIWNVSEDFAFLHGLTLNANYIILLHRTNQTAQAYFNLNLLPYVSPPIAHCNYQQEDCFVNELDNGNFSYFTVSPSNPSSGYKFNAPFNANPSQICAWTYGVSSPNVNDATSTNPHARLEFNQNIHESIAQTTNLNTNKGYEFGIKVRAPFALNGANSIVDLVVYSIDQTDFNTYKTTATSGLVKSFDPNLYSSVQTIMTIPQNEITNEFKEFFTCFGPNKSDNVILITIPTGRVAYTLDVDDVFLREFQLEIDGLDAFDEYTRNCPLDRIGAICPHEGASYTWNSPGSNDVNLLNDRYVAQPLINYNPLAAIYNLRAYYPNVAACDITSSNFTIKPRPATYGTETSFVNIPHGTTIHQLIYDILGLSPNPNSGNFISLSEYNFVVEGDFIIDVAGHAFEEDYKIQFNDCEFYCNEGSKITIKKGNGAYFYNSSLSNCANSAFWKGFEIEGDKNKPQTEEEQGKLFLQSTTIEKAEKAIVVALIDSDGNFIPESAGGIVTSRSATFLNNIEDVIYYPYSNIDPQTQQVVSNLGSFISTNFLQTSNLPTNSQGASSITLKDVDGIEFKGCKFENSSPFFGHEDQETAIKAENSSFKIRNGDFPSIFEGFAYAIHSSATTALVAFDIDDTEFKNNTYGIYVGGNDFYAITRNTFEVPDQFGAYGLYLQDGNGYEVEENTFKGAISGQRTGLVINGTATTENQIYNNSFEDLYTGTLVHGDQRLNNPQQTGLQILCNDYTTNGFHIAVKEYYDNGSWIPADIAYNQGINPLGNNNQDKSKDPAGNTFANSCTGSGQNDVSADQTTSFFYYNHHDEIATTPSCVTNIKVLPQVYTGLSFVKANACPSNLSSGGGGNQGNPGGGPLRKKKGTKQAINRIALDSISADSADFDAVLLGDFIRYHLLKDTLGLDSITTVLEKSNMPAYQIRYAAALHKKKDTATLNRKGLKNNLSPMLASYFDYQASLELNQTSKLELKAVEDREHPLYIWAKAKVHQQNGSPMPMHMNLPESSMSQQQILAENELSLAPNPTKESVQISWKNGTAKEIQLQSIQGKVLKVVPLSLETNRYHLKVADLSNGIYVLQLILEDGSLLQEKLIIQQ